MCFNKKEKLRKKLEKEFDDLKRETRRLINCAIENSTNNDEMRIFESALRKVNDLSFTQEQARENLKRLFGQMQLLCGRQETEQPYSTLLSEIKNTLNITIPMPDVPILGPEAYLEDYIERSQHELDRVQQEIMDDEERLRDRPRDYIILTRLTIAKNRAKELTQKLAILSNEANRNSILRAMQEVIKLRGGLEAIREIGDEELQDIYSEYDKAMKKALQDKNTIETGTAIVDRWSGAIDTFSDPVTTESHKYGDVLNTAATVEGDDLSEPFGASRPKNTFSETISTRDINEAINLLTNAQTKIKIRSDELKKEQEKLKAQLIPMLQARKNMSEADRQFADMDIENLQSRYQSIKNSLKAIQQRNDICKEELRTLTAARENNQFDSIFADIEKHNKLLQDMRGLVVQLTEAIKKNNDKLDDAVTANTLLENQEYAKAPKVGVDMAAEMSVPANSDNKFSALEREFGLID